MSSLRTMPSAPPLKNNWPSMDEVVQKITRYWNSIAAMDAAYAKVSEPASILYDTAARHARGTVALRKSEPTHRLGGLAPKSQIFSR